VPRASVQSNSEILFKLRREKGLTQEQVALDAGISKRQYERIESGGSSTLATLTAIAEVLGCDLDSLIEPSGVNEKASFLGQDTKETVEAHLNRKRLSQRMRTAKLSDLLSTARSCISLVVRTASIGDIHLSLRKDATMGELAYAVAKKYFKDDYQNCDWLITDAEADEYDIAMTAGELAANSVSTVCLRRLAGLPLALSSWSVWVGNALKRFCFSLGSRVARLKWKGYILKELRCRFYVWLYTRGPLLNRIPPSVVVGDMAGLVQLYTEANVKTGQAVEMIKLMDRNESSAKYRNEMAWACYRAGSYRAAFRLIVDNPSEQDYKLKNKLSMTYHLYFICKKLGFTKTSDEIQRLFREVIEPQVRRGMYSLTPPLYDLECERVRLSDESLSRVAHVAK
jgi:transcriptional regulator with XRE-family HTH domain